MHDKSDNLAFDLYRVEGYAQKISIGHGTSELFSAERDVLIRGRISKTLGGRCDGDATSGLRRLFAMSP